MNNITLIVKPLHGCNLQCKYCYNKENRSHKEILDVDEAGQFIKMIAKTHDTIDIIWHGGEPMLLSIEDWFRPMYDKYINPLSKIVTITSSAQSNGTILNNDIIAFLKRYKMYLGLSYDGMFQDQNRGLNHVYLKNREIALSCGMPYWENALTVVTPENCSQIVENYVYSKENGVVLEFSEMFSPEMTLEDHIKIAESFVKLFDYIVFHTNDPIRRPYHSLISFIVKGAPEPVYCNMQDCSCKWLGVSSDGSIYPCGRYWTEEYKIGHIHDVTSFEDIKSSQTAIKLKAAHLKLANKCKDCDIKSICGSGCPNTRLINTGSISAKDECQCAFNKVLHNGVKEILLKAVGREDVNTNIKKAIKDWRN